MAACGCVPASWSLCRADIRNATVLAVPFRRRRFIPRRRLHSLLALKFTSGKPGTHQHPSVSAKISSCFEGLRSPRTVAVHPASCNPKVCRLREASLPRSSAFVVRWCLHLSPPFSHVSCSSLFFPRTTFTPYASRFALLRLIPTFAMVQKRLSPAAQRSMPGGVCISALPFCTSAVRFPFSPFPLVSPLSTATVITYPPDRDRAKKPSRDFGRC